ncbi:MAG: amidohydrolase family protein [Gammaproteobacteria bacterium]
MRRALTQLTDAEIERVAEAGVHVLPSLTSSSPAAIARLERAGVNVASAPMAARAQRPRHVRRTAHRHAGQGGCARRAALPAHRALGMATLNGARALGLGKEIGSLTPGKWADIAAVDLGVLETEPVYHPISQLAYATSRHQVSDVWVAGKRLLKRRQLTTLDGAAIVQRARAWRQKIGN